VPQEEQREVLKIEHSDAERRRHDEEPGHDGPR